MRMKKFLEIKPLWIFIIFTVLDIICIGMGMGVPFFCILFGFPVGWVAVRYITASTSQTSLVFRKTLVYAALTSCVTLVGMAILWIPFATQLFDPTVDLAETGIPMILYEPRASFIGWVVLMLLISPALQFLTTLFGSHLALLGWLNRGTNPG
jgi:hypothetical protein